MNTQHTPEDLLDTDGENRAVRMFLAIYGTSSLTIQAMKRHLECCGYPYWPEWADKYQAGDTTHLTKLGAQNWLRHLFALEPEAIHARACVNACSGMADGELAGFKLIGSIKKYIAELQRQRDEAQQQRDDLRASLDRIEHALNSPNFTYQDLRTVIEAEAAKAGA